MDNEIVSNEAIFTKELATEVALVSVACVAATVTTWAGMIAVAATAGKIADWKSKRKAKKAAIAE